MTDRRTTFLDPLPELPADKIAGKTSTLRGPWTLVEAEDKRWARVKTLETVAVSLARRTGGELSAGEGARPG